LSIKMESLSYCLRISI